MYSPCHNMPALLLSVRLDFSLLLLLILVPVLSAQTRQLW